MATGFMLRFESRNSLKGSSDPCINKVHGFDSQYALWDITLWFPQILCFAKHPQFCVAAVWQAVDNGKQCGFRILELSTQTHGNMSKKCLSERIYRRLPHDDFLKHQNSF